jgi:hypothetical protein
MEHKYEMTNPQAIEMLETFKKVFDTPDTNYREALIGSIDKGIEAIKTTDMWSKMTIDKNGNVEGEGLPAEALQIIERIFRIGYNYGYHRAKEEDHK